MVMRAASPVGTLLQELLQEDLAMLADLAGPIAAPHRGQGGGVAAAPPSPPAAAPPPRTAAAAAASAAADDDDDDGAMERQPSPVTRLLASLAPATSPLPAMDAAAAHDRAAPQPHAAPSAAAAAAADSDAAGTTMRAMARHMSEQHAEAEELRRRLGEVEGQLAAALCELEACDADAERSTATIVDLRAQLDAAVEAQQTTIPRIVADELELRLHAALEMRGELLMRGARPIFAELTALRHARSRMGQLSTTAADSALARNSLVLELGAKVEVLERQSAEATTRASAAEADAADARAQLAMCDVLWREEKGRLQHRQRRLEQDLAALQSGCTAAAAIAGATL